MEHLAVNMADVSEGNVLGMIWKPRKDVLKFKANSDYSTEGVKMCLPVEKLLVKHPKSMIPLDYYHHLHYKQN